LAEPGSTGARHLCLLGDANSVHVRRWAGEMLARGWRVSVVTARPEPIDGAEQRVLAPVRRSADWLLRANQARETVAELAPDIVHAHYVTSYGYLAARCGRHPIVMTAWGSDILLTPRRSALLRWLTGWTLRRADLITGDSLDLLDAMRVYRPTAPLRQIHWGADLARFSPSAWDLKPGFQIASLRSWEPNYSIDVIVRALALLARTRSGAGAHLHLLGGGSQEEALRALVRSLGLDGQVTFHGRLDDAGMSAVMQACKVSVSVPVSDATSVSVLESMACGLPVVATDLPANRQWLEAGDGALVPAGDPLALAAALQAWCEDEDRARCIGERNRRRMEAEGARKVQMDAMSSLYDQLLRGDLPRAASD
jgi:glycosyltransferase involved in cell wall biosynthesis